MLNDIYNSFDLFQIILIIDITDDSIQIPLSSVKSLLVSTLTKLIKVLKLTYSSFKMQSRVDLVFWIGISTVFKLDLIFIIPLLDFYASKSNHSELSKSVIPS
jgi:CRISPR/Cas system CMR subunit Cmr6 (Cas7 group RAMP superfamily)